MHLLSRLSLLETGKLAFHTNDGSTTLFFDFLLDFSPEDTPYSWALQVDIPTVFIVTAVTGISDYSLERTLHSLDSLGYLLEVDTLRPSFVHSLRKDMRFEVMSLTS